MKRMISLGITTLLLSPLAFATPTVALSGPTPAIAATYGSDSVSTIVYTIRNYFNHQLPLSISGISSPIQRVQVSNDCGYGIPSGNPNYPATCQIGISISPTEAEVGSFISQKMLVDIGGRAPLMSSISFTVVAAVYPSLTSFVAASGVAVGANFIPGLGTLSSSTIHAYGLPLLSPGVCDASTTIGNYPGVPVTIISDTLLTIPNNFPNRCFALCNNTIVSTTYPGQSADCTNVILAS